MMFVFLLYVLYNNWDTMRAVIGRCLSVNHSPNGSCATFLFLSHFDLLFNWTNARQNGIYLLNILKMFVQAKLAKWKIREIANKACFIPYSQFSSAMKMCLNQILTNIFWFKPLNMIFIKSNLCTYDGVDLKLKSVEGWFWWNYFLLITITSLSGFMWTS